MAAAVLASCSGEEKAPAKAEGTEHVACALGEGASFAKNCAVERAIQDGKAVLVVRHPDGGFRRFVVEPDGKGVALADGAEVPAVAISGNLLDVTVGQDRYRIPFTVKGAR